mgnify:CR=1 FL=1
MTEKSERTGGILGDFSVSQLLATALAAATSFALSTQIGVAGSIIGAVVGAVASAVATQVYRNILASSAEKLRALGGADETRAVGSVSGRAIVEEVAASGTPIAPPEVRDAARERDALAVFLGVSFQIVYAERKGRETLRVDTDDPVVPFFNGGKNIAADGGDDHFAVVVVRMIAHDLRPARRGKPFFRPFPRLLFKVRGERFRALLECLLAGAVAVQIPKLHVADPL